jgi:Xaa-Pro aminopeptidase
MISSQWPFSAAFFEGNRERLTNLMEPDAMAVLFSNDQMPRSGDQYFPFRQNSDLFHHTGIRQEKTILMLFPNCPSERLREALFIMRPIDHVERWEGKKLTIELAREISGIRNVFYNEEFESCLREAMYHTEQVYLDTQIYGKFNPDVSPRALRFGLQIHHEYPFHQYRRLGMMLAKVRKLKNDTEIEVITKASRITASAFRRAAKALRPGMMEYQVQAEIEHEFRSQNATGHAFHPIIASGINATYLHYNYNQAECKAGDLLLMDFGCEYFGYASDLSRTIPVSGTFTPRQKEVYNEVLKVMRYAKPLFTSGNSIESIQREVNGLMQEAMVRLKLFTEEDVRKQDPASPLFLRYFPHGLSHHVGLDVHDPGKKQDPLSAGMVVTLEPGIYIPEEQLGVRLETMLVITRRGPVDLFEELELEPEQIETLMKP